MKRTGRLLAAALSLAGWQSPAPPQTVQLAGLQAPVEILQDRWGIPHIYARNTADLFFAQGWITARDRLFQIDAWRRTGTGQWAEVKGPSALATDRFARLVAFRGDWDAEWASYHPQARLIATAFTSGINAYIRALPQRPAQFARAGYDPGLWRPEDITARIAGLVMMRNLSTEVSRAISVRERGIAETLRRAPLDPPVALEPPPGLDFAGIGPELLAEFSAIRRINGSGDSDALEDEGSNNWVIHGSRTATGKPILANDPHRPILVPSLRKTVHLVAPGWNIIGAGEPALPGIALGHNEQAGFGFTIVGIDQMDLIVETLHPSNLDQYRDGSAWRTMRVVRESIAVRGQAAAGVELRYTVRGPVLKIDAERRRAYVLRWVGSEPGSAGYLPALRLSQARNWNEFLEAAKSYKVPSENLVYADRAGHIGWVAAGAAPVRKGYRGLLPVPGDPARYDWTGTLPLAQHPQRFDPPEGWIATANHNILPPGYPHTLGHEFSAPYRFQRIAETLPNLARHSLTDSVRLQQDIVSIPARRLTAALPKLRPLLRGPALEIAGALANWDHRMHRDSRPAALFAVWLAELSDGFTTEAALRQLESPSPDSRWLNESAAEAWEFLRERLGSDSSRWTWGALHTVSLGRNLPTSGHATTVNAAGGAAFRHTSGASYRQILDLADWDRSLMTNVPGESGDPASPHAFDLVEGWADGRYHPLLYSRAAIEAATRTRILLQPAPR